MKKLFLLFIFPFSLYSQSSYIVNAGMMYYTPSVLNIDIGDTVHWVNDGGFHNVNFDISSISGLSFNNPESFISDATSDLNIYSHVFTIAGNYEYDCSIYGHASSGMTGTIVVNTVSLIAEQSTSKKIIGVYSVLGNLMGVAKNKIIIYKYSDGTVEKRIFIE